MIHLRRKLGAYHLDDRRSRRGTDEERNVPVYLKELKTEISILKTKRKYK